MPGGSGRASPPHGLKGPRLEKGRDRRHIAPREAPQECQLRQHCQGSRRFVEPSVTSRIEEEVQIHAAAMTPPRDEGPPADQPKVFFAPERITEAFPNPREELSGITR